MGGGVATIFFPLQKTWQFTSCLTWASTVISGKQHEPNTTSKHIIDSMMDTDSTDQPPKQVFSINPHKTVQHVQSTSSNVKLFFSFFFCVWSGCFHSFSVSSSRPLFMKTLYCPDKNILNYCRSSLNLKSTLCIHSTYLNCLLWGCDWYATEKKTNNLLKILQYGDIRGYVWSATWRWRRDLVPPRLFLNYRHVKLCIQTGHPCWEQVFGILGTTANVH